MTIVDRSPGRRPEVDVDFRRKVVRKIKQRNKEVHISMVRHGGIEGVEIRDFIPAAGRYGRGVLLSREAFVRLVTEAGPEIVDYQWPKGAPGEGQGQLA